MSVTLMSAVWVLDLPTTDKMVLLALADAANDDGVTWLAVKSRTEGKRSLLTKCSLSERAIQGAIKRLCDGGYLSRADRPGRGVVWTVTPAADAPPQQMRPAADAPAPAADAGKPSLNHQLPSEAKASSVRAREPKPKASKRCPADWTPSPADLATAADLGFSPGEIERELATIRDCTFGVARSDWSATFRNWFRREAKNRKPRNDRPSPDRKYDAKLDNYHASWTGADGADQVLASRRDF